MICRQSDALNLCCGLPGEEVPAQGEGQTLDSAVYEIVFYPESSHVMWREFFPFAYLLFVVAFRDDRIVLGVVGIHEYIGQDLSNNINFHTFGYFLPPLFK